MAGVGGGARLVGHPNLNAVDGDARGDGGQLLHALVVAVAEEVGQEEVAVLVVGIGRELKGGELYATARTYALCARLLLRNDGAQFQFAKLQVGTHAEERVGATNEARRRGHRYVARLEQFDDFILLALVTQFEVLRVKVEGGLTVVVEVHVYLIAHLTVQTKVDFLVEVEAEYFAVAFGERRVVGEAHVGAYFQFGATLRLDAHAARTEHLVERSEVEVHVGKVEFVLPLFLEGLRILLAIPCVAGTLLHPAGVLVGGEVKGRFEEVVAQSRAEVIGACGFVEHRLVLEVLGVFQVDGAACRVGRRAHHGGLYAEAAAVGRGSSGLGNWRRSRLLTARGLMRTVGKGHDGGVCCPDGSQSQ